MSRLDLEILQESRSLLWENAVIETCEHFHMVPHVHAHGSAQVHIETGRVTGAYRMLLAG